VRRDEEFGEYVAARLGSLRRTAYLLCQDWQQADDLVQTTVTKLYVHWGRARAVEHTDAYVRAILVRQFFTERRAGWARLVSLRPSIPEAVSPAADVDGALDVREALNAVPPRQRATLVLRFYCDLSVDQAAEVLGCTAGTVKSQTAKALETLRRALEHGAAPASRAPDRTRRPAKIAKVHDHG
jgi:RNA polymerase sigma-70 factor (sigma-E family)